MCFIQHLLFPLVEVLKSTEEGCEPSQFSYCCLRWACGLDWEAISYGSAKFFRASLPFRPFFLFLFFPCLFLFFLLLFPAMPPISPSPSALPLSVCETTCSNSVYLACLPSWFPVSVSQMEARWTSSSHCYLPADSGEPPSLPPFLA